MRDPGGAAADRVPVRLRRAGPHRLAARRGRSPQQPTVAVEPDGAGWRIPAAEAVAHIEVDIRSLFDGSVRHVSEDVPFLVTGAITVLPDGSASITVGGPDTN